MGLKKVLISIAAPTAAIGTLVGMPIAAVKLTDMLLNPEVDNSKFEKYENDFLKTNRGDIIRLPIDENPIPVVLGDMDKKTKEYIVEGINCLDNISENINYTIFDADDFNVKSNVKHISFEVVDTITDSSPTTAGNTTFKYSNRTAEILYPIEIKIEDSYADWFWDAEYTQSVLTTIVKHELMHTLGFKDLYNEEDKNRSIMYYGLANDSPSTYTQEDIEKIQYCYDGKEVATTSHPNKVEILNYSNYLDDLKKQKEQDDGLSL